MSWKKLPFWLKEGVYGFFGGIIVNILLMIFIFLGPEAAVLVLFILSFPFGHLGIILLEVNSVVDGFIAEIIMFIALPLNFFFWGCLIGYFMK